ncbi:MAG: Ig-like domain-containing protein [Candidatus Sumerlaeota bacterium]|nr:Ig-like domain-containing protein [Candidatus Sumerlaeota bacterium]
MAMSGANYLSTIRVQFSEPVTGATSLTATNYAISGAGRGTMTMNPTAVTVVNSLTVLLTWTNAGEMLNGAAVTITVFNIQDITGNVIGAQNSGNGTGIGIAPSVASVAVQTGTNNSGTIAVTFNEPMGPTSLTATNYAISGAGRGTMSTNPTGVSVVNSSTVLLTWTNAGEMMNGSTVTITVSNAQDLAGNVIGTPNSGSDTGIGVAPAVTGIVPVNDHTINLAFNEPMGASSTTAANYSVSGLGVGTLAVNPNTVCVLTSSSVQLSWNLPQEMNGSQPITVTVVSAVKDLAGNGVGIPNSASATAIGAAPWVSGIAVVDNHTIDVTFSEAMGATSLTAANYTVSGLSVGTLASNPNSVVRQSSNSVVRLTWNTPQEMNGGQTITVTVASAVQDLAGNGVGTPNNASATAIGTPTTVVSITIVNEHTINLQFSEPMAATSLTAANYAVSGLGAAGTLAVNPNTVIALSSSSVELLWNLPQDMLGGHTITVTVASAVQDLAGNALGTPNSASATAIGVLPTVVSAASTTATVVRVVFSEPMLNNAALINPTNYTFTGAVALTPSAVAVVDPLRVDVTVNEMTDGASYLVTVNATNVGPTDLARNHINVAAQTVPFTGMGDLPWVIAAAPTTATVARVTFSADMTNDTAFVNSANYAFAGSVPLTIAGVTRVNARTVDITVNEMTDGAPYTVFANSSLGGPTDLAAFNHVDPLHDHMTFTGLGDLPRVSINQVAGQIDPTSQTMMFDIIFTEPVYDLTFSDIAFTGSATGSIGTITGGPTAYLLTITSSSADGTVVPTLPAGRVFDVAANNPNVPSTSMDNSVLYDTTPPLSWVEIPTTGTIIIEVPFKVQWNFSDAMPGSGVKSVKLYMNFNFGWQSFVAAFDAATTATMLDYTLAPNNGMYGFYTIATDFAGNEEVYTGFDVYALLAIKGSSTVELWNRY